MRKLIFLLTPLLILTILFLLVVLFINRDEGRGALQATSVPKAQVFIEGKYVGNTPLCLCDVDKLLRSGDYTIKLTPVQKGFKTYEQKVTIHAGVLSVVDRTFDKEIPAASGSTITLAESSEKEKSEILIISFPARAQVILDSNPEGITPLYLEDITASDHEIKIIKDGYKDKIIKVKTIGGKRLEATVSLGIMPDINLSPSKKSTVSAVTSSKIIILDTPTGFLRVRKADSTNSPQIGTVNPGDKLDLISEKEEWYEVELTDGKTGWISSAYARKE